MLARLELHHTDAQIIYKTVVMTQPYSVFFYDVIQHQEPNEMASAFILSPLLSAHYKDKNLNPVTALTVKRSANYFQRDDCQGW